MEQRLPLICDALEELFHPSGIVARNESPLRVLENLPQEKRILRGSVKETRVAFNSIVFNVDPLNGQKTGLFLDQRENHWVLRRFTKGAVVLDCFCNDGGFALNAFAGGAESVLGIDASEEAVTRASVNAELNNCTNVRFEQGDVFEKLKALHQNNSTFDVIVLDPPSFTKSRKHIHTAKKGYKELNTCALSILRSGGILVTASCSHHILPEVFLDLVTESGRKSNHYLQLLDWRGAAPDHPVLPTVPETHYLKLGVFRVL
jgi:23S rRNA (cytosine1962-C5)-methyltransferase